MNYRPKELSWLSFNARVLQEAADPSVPLFERVKFLGIYSSNLDEFFRVRVATLNRLALLGQDARKILGYDPKIVLKQVQKSVLVLNREFDEVYLGLIRDLAEKNIFIVDETGLSPEQQDYVRNYFNKTVRPKLIPIMIDQVEKIPDMRDDSIYLAVSLKSRTGSRPTKSALIEIPSDVLPRFVILPQTGEKRSVILLDDVIRFNLRAIFSLLPYDRFQAYTVKLSRDAELDIGDDLSQSYINKLSHSLKQRKEGNPVRFIYDERIPEPFLKLFIKKLKLSKIGTLIPGTRYHNFKDFIKFPDFGQTQLKYPDFQNIPHHEVDQQKSFFQIVRKKDILLHYPYHTFNHVIDLLREASIDPKVKSIKITLYRVARDSSVINALINAVKNGKTVVVILELQARFDEAANIYWAQKLQEEGVRVIYGVPGLKVHAKLCLITRRRPGGAELFAIVATGNFNEDTARIYSDHSLFTADKRITMEVKNVFDFFENNYYQTSFKHLIVSPFDLRKKINLLIRNEIKNVKEGKPAYIFIKLNNLVDFKVINLLYTANEAGVKIRLLVRGMISLVTGLPGISEHIEAYGLVDKFLEHSRIFIFCNNGNPKYFITSADLMQRNIDRRVEVTCPIYDKSIQEELSTFMEIQWRDNTKSRILNKSLNNHIRPNGNHQKNRAQWQIYDFLKELHGPGHRAE